MALPQERLIARVRDQCLADSRLVAALMYGSFASGEADAHSDIEFWLFFSTPVSPLAWLADLGPIRFTVVNEFGAHVVVFPGLIRGEFHFASDISAVAAWPARGAPTDRMLILDRTGALRRALDSLPDRPDPPTDVSDLCGRFANWLILAHQVARRGELLRAVDALAHAQRHLLWMVRLAEGRTQHWLTPSRNAEADLPIDVVREIHRINAAGSPDIAIAAMWRCGRRYWQRLAALHGFQIPLELFADLDTVAAY